ncbi:peptidoglycan-binding protein [Streptomyces sp. NBC_01465]|uniref:peptidoglycan-binding protein n=1 Tax=Streptomyces sp. NBC_01465 TaxID=2903878 RepID=UPI002E3436E1|nr:peptidoglycan-binding protein [Streptomyces sp. NBC_01465]
MKRRRVLVSSAVVLAVIGGAAVAATTLSARDTGTVGKDTGLPPATASVERGDLSDSTQVDGVLGYAKERKVNAGAAGTLTWAAGAGSSVKRDGKLYEIDGTPVRLMYGAGPMYRTLKTGDKGRDVRQLEENLAALGYTGFTVDDEYSALTADAVERWQKSHGLKETGQAGPDQIAFAPGAVRVKETEGAVGDQVAPGRPVLRTTGSERIVTFSLAVAESKSVKVGAGVSVGLPDGSTAKGKIASVGKTARPGDDPQDKTPKIGITVAFDEPDKVGGIDQSPVTVDLTGQTRTGVLTVPVDALLALSGGGFGVQVVENGTAREVKVELGLFGQGRVEVSGGGLREGMKVGVPKI